VKRVAHLDGIRGLAVALVVFHHWTATGHAMDLGNIGVQLFFVLSGFLITGILIDTRTALDAGTVGLGEGLGNFWKRRATRILPVFLFTLTLIALAGSRFEKPENMPWHFLFASNLLFFARGTFEGTSLAHFWTLAVEQQFYLAWPLVVVLAPRRSLEKVMLALIVLAPMTRIALYAAGFHEFPQYNVLPLASFDSLGLGALMALWIRMPAEQAQGRWHALSVCAVVATVAFVLNRAFGRLPANVEQTFYAVIFAWVVGTSSRHIEGIAARVLEWRPLVALGIVSYGVYVYHMFGPRLVGFGLRTIGAPLEWHTGVPLFLLSAVFTLGVACASWFLMERPIINAGRSRTRRPQPAKLEGADVVR
jgi:peptidoglycan/LPS O-acetylase OafA/YrhL